MRRCMLELFGEAISDNIVPSSRDTFYRLPCQHQSVRRRRGPPLRALNSTYTIPLMPAAHSKFSPPKILIFDSGVGGLSVLDEIRRLTPWCQLVYASDNAAFPYGLKEEMQLVDRVDRVLRHLIEREQPDVLVVACNTASTLALPHIRSHFERPVVGVVPAIKPAAQLSKTGVIGLLATPGTIARPYTQQLIDDFAPDCEVIRIGSSRLVELAEQHLRGLDVAPDELHDIVAPLFQATPRGEADVMVLACTHFPLIRHLIAGASPRSVAWIDSGAAIARRVASLLPGDADQSLRYFHWHCLFTAPDPSLDALQPALTRLECVSVEVVAVP